MNSSTEKLLEFMCAHKRNPCEVHFLSYTLLTSSSTFTTIFTYCIIKATKRKISRKKSKNIF